MFAIIDQKLSNSYMVFLKFSLLLMHLLAHIHLFRDIKGANILVDPNGQQTKLADFGMAKHVSFHIYGPMATF